MKPFWNVKCGDCKHYDETAYIDLSDVLKEVKQGRCMFGPPQIGYIQPIVRADIDSCSQYSKYKASK